MSESELLEQGLGYHQSGDFQNADRCYQAVLGQNPQNFHALHLMGVLAHQVGRNEIAIPLLEKAVQLAPRMTEFHNNLGSVYKASGRFEDAVLSFKRVLKLDPNHVMAANNLGATYLDVGKYKDALKVFRDLVKKEKNNPQIYYHLGLTCIRLDNYDEGVRYYKKALEIQPNYEDACNNICLALLKNSQVEEGITIAKAFLEQTPESARILLLLGNLYQELSRWDEAIGCFQKVLMSDVNNIKAEINLGLCFKEINEWDGAKLHLNKAVDLDADSFEAHFNLGVFYHDLKEYGLAIKHFNESLRIQPDSDIVLMSLGGSYFRAMELESAKECFTRLCERKPKDAEVLRVLALVYHEIGNRSEAKRILLDGLRYDAKNADLHAALGFLCLQEGDYLSGWREFEWRWQCKGFTTQKRNFGSVPWSGEDLKGKKIFVSSEQGYGDVLQFLRFIPLLKEHGAESVYVEGQKELLPLIDQHPGVDQWICKGDHLPVHDYNCPMMSLPHFLKIAEDLIPPASRMEIDLEQGPVLPAIEQAKIKVGIVWAGNPVQVNDHNRSMSLQQLAPLLDLDGIQFYSLQIGERAKDITLLGYQDRIIDLSPNVNNFHDSAVLIKQLDLVITVCTSVSHLCGFLQHPCWTMLCFNPDWRWGLETERSLWYPNTRLFRQQKIRDWGGVVSCVKESLQAMTQNRSEIE